MIPPKVQHFWPHKFELSFYTIFNLSFRVSMNTSYTVDMVFLFSCFSVSKIWVMWKNLSKRKFHNMKINFCKIVIILQNAQSEFLQILRCI